MVDALVFKATLVSRVAQIARIEIKLRDYLLLKWRQRSLQAIKRAAVMFRNGSSADVISAKIRSIMNKWSKDVTRRMFRDIERAYKLAREAGSDKARGKIKGSLQYDSENFSGDTSTTVTKAEPFLLADEEAVLAIQENQLFWIGDHYDDKVSSTIRDVTRRTVIEAGTNRAQAAKLLQERLGDVLATVKTPSGFGGSSAQYFDGVVANAVTNARAMGQLRSFADLDVERFQIVNPSDRRTCPVCSHLNGKIFTVQQGKSQMKQDLAAERPEDIKASHPWLKIKDILKISTKPGMLSGKSGVKDSRDLANSGVCMPPFHFLCRCTIDIV